MIAQTTVNSGSFVPILNPSRSLTEIPPNGPSAALVTAGVYALTQSWHIALVFGAISAATDPATTVDVLAEYDAKGPLTTSLLAVVGMDDALALMIFSIAAATAESLFTQTGAPSLLQIAALPVIEIGGSVVLGFAMGLLLDFILCVADDRSNRHQARHQPRRRDRTCQTGARPLGIRRSASIALFIPLGHPPASPAK